MSNGYGRGYYGSAQIDRPRRSGNGWFKIAVVGGLGAVVWFWWRRPSGGPKYAEAPSPPSEHVEALSPPPRPPTEQEDLDHLARLRGFSSTKMYEDAMVASARELQASGAKVVFAPHLQHLEVRLEPDQYGHNPG
jgi:hypothetical protein